VVDGKRWDDIMRDRLFDPMGLVDTSSWRAHVDQRRAATGHIINTVADGPVVTPLDYLPRAFGPGGQVSSTVREVLTMADLFRTGGIAPNGNRIVSAALIREMMESRVSVPDPYLFGPQWALGLIVCDWLGETVFASDGSTIGQHARLRIIPDSGIAVAMLANGGPRDRFYRAVFQEILAELGQVTIPDLPKPDPARRIDMSRYEGVFARPEARFEVTTEAGKLFLTVVTDPMRASLSGQPERLRYELQPVSETHFLMASDDPDADIQTVAIYDVKNGVSQYLHTNCRVHPRIGG
jgi:CubicO group peptidase (beta-lactamase class C family)